MEILELKSHWALLQQEVAEQDFKSEDTLAERIHQKSRLELSQIKKSLHTKFVIAGGAILVGLGIIIAILLDQSFNPLDFALNPQESIWFYGIMVLSLAIMLIFNLTAYNRIKKADGSSANIKENLEAFIQSMKVAIKFNIYSDTFVTPVIFTWVYYIYAYKEATIEFDLRGILLIVLPVGIGVLSYFIQRHMQRLKFGNYLSRLKSYLGELKDF